jgi:hypothetical protein
MVEAESQSEAPARGGWKCWRYWLVPALLGAALFAINLRGTWVYDDLAVARGDDRLKSIHQWGRYFTGLYMEGAADNLWRPFTSLSYAIEWQFHGDRAWPFHLINLLLHAIVSAQVAELGRRLSGRRGVGLIAGLLFAAHPIHVDAVTMIVGRAEELCALGVLASLLLVIGRRMTTARAFGATGWFLFAALSKEHGILLPFMLGLWGLTQWLGKSSADAPAGRLSDDERQAYFLLGALLMITLSAYISVRNHFAPWFWERYFLDWTINPVVRSHGVNRALLPVAILGRYAALLVAPWRLSLDYSAYVFTTVESVADPYLWLGFLALAAWLAAAGWALVRRRGALLFCLGCLGIAYFLASNVISIGTVFGERLMYLPSVFACVLAAVALWQIAKTPRAVVVGLIVVAFCVRTETYAWHWNDRPSFYAYSLRNQPKSAQLHLLLADQLHRLGQIEESERIIARGRAVAPGAWRLWFMSAQFAVDRGDYRKAVPFAKEAFHLRPGADTSELYSDVLQRSATQPATQP